MKARNALVVAIATVLGAGVAAAHAQQAFKYVMPDGRIVYSDKPVAGGRLVDELAPPPPPSAAPAPTPRQEQLREQRNAVRERISDRDREFERAQASLQDARARLEQAERNLMIGKEPLPGERTGNVGGGSRLNELYWQRQAANEAEVEKARAQVRQAEADLGQLR